MNADRLEFVGWRPMIAKLYQVSEVTNQKEIALLLSVHGIQALATDF